MKKLDPKAVWLFFFSFVSKLLFLVLIFGLYFGFIIFELSGGSLLGFAGLLLLIAIALLIFLFVWAKLTYKFYRYELTDDGFRKELGVIWKKYTTIPYDRIQNVDIYRGIIARVLGLSDLHIQTAGLSASVSRYGSSGIGAEGRLPGLSKETAEQLRDELISRAKQGRNQGL